MKKNHLRFALILIASGTFIEKCPAQFCEEEKTIKRPSAFKSIESFNAPKIKNIAACCWLGHSKKYFLAALDHADKIKQDLCLFKMKTAQKKAIVKKLSLLEAAATSITTDPSGTWICLLLANDQMQLFELKNKSELILAIAKKSIAAAQWHPFQSWLAIYNHEKELISVVDAQLKYKPNKKYNTEEEFAAKSEQSIYEIAINLPVPHKKDEKIYLEWLEKKHNDANLLFWQKDNEPTQFYCNPFSIKLRPISFFNIEPTNGIFLGPSPKGTFTTRANGKTLYIFRGKNKKLRLPATTEVVEADANIITASWHPNELTIALFCEDKTVTLIKAQEKVRLEKFKKQCKTKPLQSIVQLKGWHPDGSSIILEKEEGSFLLISAAEAKEEQSIERIFQLNNTRHCWNKGGTKLISWDTQGTKIHTFNFAPIQLFLSQLESYKPTSIKTMQTLILKSFLQNPEMPQLLCEHSNSELKNSIYAYYCLPKSVKEIITRNVKLKCDACFDKTILNKTRMTKTNYS